MRKGHISLFLCDFAYIMTFLCFQGEPSGFIGKHRISGGLRRRLEVQGSPGHQEQGNKRKTGKARPCAQEQQSSATQENGMATPCLVARSCHHARVAVGPTHGRASGGAGAVKLFLRFFFSGDMLHSGFSWLFPLALGLERRT